MSTLLSDPEMVAALDFQTRRPEHAAGSGVSGCSEFPKTWNEATINEKIEETLASGGWRAMGATRAYFRQLEDVWLYVLVRMNADDTSEIIAAFPLWWSPGVSYNEPSQQDLLSTTLATMLQVLTRELNSDRQDWVTIGEALNHCGQRAEAAVWLIEFSNHEEVVFAEDTYINLYLLALRGCFRDAREDPEQIIARAWAHAYPTRWGLIAYPDWVFEIDVSRSLLPTTTEIAELARDWLQQLFRGDAMSKTAHPAEAFFLIARTSKDEITARFGSDKRARLTALCEEGDVRGPADIWEVNPGSPRSAIAAIAVMLAMCELSSDTRMLDDTENMDRAERMSELVVPDALRALTLHEINA